MRRRHCLGLLAGLAVWPYANARTPVRKIGWLTGGSPESHARLLQAFRDELKAFGWQEGVNIELELRWARGDNARLPNLAADLVARNPDVIVTAAMVVHQAVAKQTSAIPIVMVTGTDPVEAGLVKSLARPGTNVTGMAGFFEATPLKMLELAAALVPRGSRVAVLADAATQFSNAGYRSEVDRAARTLGLQAEQASAASVADVERVVQGLGGGRVAAVLFLPSPMFFFLAARLPALAAPLKVPAIYPFEECADAGGLISYAAPLTENYRRAAFFVDRILRGSRPGDMPIEQPTRLVLAINLRTAKTQGFRLPNDVLLRADRVIE